MSEGQTVGPALNPTRPVRAGEELDWQRLDAYLKSVIDGLAGEPAVSQYPSGNSNLTYRLRYPGHDLVVRRPPFGTRARSAHSMYREYRVINALRPVFPAVPEALHYTDDEDIIGAEFYVMRRVDGVLINDRIPAEWGWDAGRTRRFCLAVWDTLIALHTVDYQAAGLADFGQPEGYASRQVGGWNRRFQQALTPDVEPFDDVQQWLTENLPARRGPPAVLHGDFRIDNLILDPGNPERIRAVLDWEICALGDPLMDLGNALAYWIEPGDPPFLRQLRLQPSDAPGMLTRAEILRHYRQRTGRDLPDFTFYYLYGMFRNTVIIQQIYYRYYHGQTQDARFAGFGRLAQALGAHCRALLREAGRL